LRLVIFGLTISSSWGNGHATLWRGLCKALARQGHEVSFYERDVEYYASNRDLTELPGGRLVLYGEWEEAASAALRELSEADAAIVSSYCPDGVAASELVLSSPVPLRAFYDLDTPVTLARLSAGEPVSYIGPRGLRDFDLVLSYTGGDALEQLRARLGARRAVPLYGSVDPELHRPTAPVEHYRADLSYLGTFAPDRQAVLEELFVEPARCRPGQRFLMGGAGYPAGFPWTPNLFFVRHLPPGEHAAFFSSSRLTLNVTRAAMAAMGWCPSGRLFEAAACNTPIVSDAWEGLDAFYEPSSEILLARNAQEICAALELSDAELQRIARNARERTLAQHTAEWRAAELIAILESPPAAREAA
jgi:spore maturation protein CgeB